MNSLIAFLGGIISFISPCVLPLVPVYIAYISGISVQELKEAKSGKNIIRILLYSLFFVLGFTIVFSLLAALFYLFIQTLGSYKIWFNRIAGLIVAVFGLHMTGIIHIPFLNYEARLHTETKKPSAISALLMGAAFGAGWSPCIGPILSGILFTTEASANPVGAVLQLIIFSIGLGLPFILTGLITNRFLSLFEGIKKHYRIVEILSGFFLIILGFILFFNWMGALSGWFSKIIPDLGNLENKLFQFK